MSQVRRPQQERSVATRARLLEAAYASLLEGGYGATTVGHVQQRAGVARGTLLHHFPTRGALMAGVVEDVVERRLQLLTTIREDDPPPADWDEVVDLLWSELRSEPFAVALELWVAARTDDDLREALLPLQERIFATVHRGVTRLAGGDHPRTPLLVQFTIDLLTGEQLASTLRPRDGTSAVVDAWKATLRELTRRP
jgi:AcrR family transcriptional regulator